MINGLIYVIKWLFFLFAYRKPLGIRLEIHCYFESDTKIYSKCYCTFKLQEEAWPIKLITQYGIKMVRLEKRLKVTVSPRFDNKIFLMDLYFCATICAILR